jgi:F-type H+-transporting ATPase subunit epsilon
MKLSIYSLKQVLFEGDARSVNCRTTSGEITVLDNHRPLISALMPGTISVIDDKGELHYVNAGAGFLEMAPDNRLRLLVDPAE